MIGKCHFAVFRWENAFRCPGKNLLTCIKYELVLLASIRQTRLVLFGRRGRKRFRSLSKPFPYTRPLVLTSSPSPTPTPLSVGHAPDPKPIAPVGQAEVIPGLPALPDLPCLLAEAEKVGPRGGQQMGDEPVPSPAQCREEGL